MSDAAMPTRQPGSTSGLLPDSGGATVLGPGTELPEVRDLPAVVFAPHPGQLLLYERG